MNMFFKDFYWLSNGYSRGEFRVEPRNLQIDPFRLVSAKELPDEPLIFDRFMGRTLFDYLPTTCPPLFLVSSKIVRLFNENAITGWTTYPVEVCDKATRIDGYAWDGSDMFLPEGAGIVILSKKTREGCCITNYLILP
jgi:hypothetical protein